MSSELSGADKERLEQMTLLDPALLKAKKEEARHVACKDYDVEQEKGLNAAAEEETGRVEVWYHRLQRRARGARTDPASKGMDAHGATTSQEAAGIGDCAEAKQYGRGHPAVSSKHQKKKTASDRC